MSYSKQEVREVGFRNMKNFDTSKTISSISNLVWHEEIPTKENSSNTILKYYNLVYKTKIKNFSSDDLRFLLGQKQSLDILVPLSIERLKKGLYVEAMYYPGDLLNSLLKVEGSFWLNNPKHRVALERLFIKNQPQLDLLDLEEDIKNEILENFECFLML